MVDSAEVKIWGEFIGAVRWDIQKQIASFQYDNTFLQKKHDLAPLKMPIQNGNQIYSFPELRKGKNETIATFNGLPGLLADALPDKYGNQLINIWLAQNGRAPNSMNPVEQLCFIGSRGMGALEFEPTQLKTSKHTFGVEIESLVDIAQKMLHNREDFNANFHKDKQQALKEILKIGTSAGGARPKAVIAFNKLTGEIRSGQTAVPYGFEHWLIKLDGVSDAQFGSAQGYGKVEYAYYFMAIACHINMSDCALLHENGRSHFMTRRFDRDGKNTKHHIQSFCGMQHFDYNNLYGYSYEQLFQTMRMLNMTYTEAEQMFRRMVFNVLATNCDDHTKNFSFRLVEGGRWHLSPAYDVCYSYDPTNVWVSQQTLSINGKHNNITKADFMTIAKANNIKKAEKIIDEIKSVICDWEDFAERSSVPKEKTKAIRNNLKAFTFET